MSDEDLIRGRAAALEAILESDEPLKLIVAGPGTGKTYTFQKVLERAEGRGLAITFLLSLVRELDAAMGEMADVYSFHGFARRLLHRLDGTGVTRGVRYYPPLVELLVEDVRIVDGPILGTMELGALFRNLVDDDPILRRALQSGEYYDSVFHDDAVYRVLCAVEEDEARIPLYPQIVVDEFQDFCPLEVAFVAMLATKSPTLIVGDDDQALYAFRDATPQAIRDLATSIEYKKFDLPYCTRCTEVIVAATHSVVNEARRAGLLAGRISKPYECFMPDKRADSQRHPKIVHAHCSTQNRKAPYMGRYIEHAIRQISEDDIRESYEKGYPTVLIIGPNPFLRQVEEHLRGHFGNVTSTTSTQPELLALSGYRFLVSDENSNVGWRILVQLLQPPAWEDAVRDALTTGSSLIDLLDPGFVSEQLEIVDLLRRIGDDEAGLDAAERAVLSAALGVAAVELERTLNPERDEQEIDESQPTIKLTSLMGSKGLQAAHVFIVGVNDEHFPRNNSDISNEEVCQLLVALTRTRKTCTVVSTGRLGAASVGESQFIRWLRPHSTYLYVDREYLRKLGS